MKKGQIPIDEKHEHMRKAWKEYNERFSTYWSRAVENLKADKYPDIEPADDAWWSDINEEMDRLGFFSFDIAEKYGVSIEHDELTITVTDFMETDGRGYLAITEDGDTMSIVD